MPRRRSGNYPSPYTAIIVLDGAMFRIAERGKRGLRAVRLTNAEAELARRTLDDAHADTEARRVGFHGR